MQFGFEDKSIAFVLGTRPELIKLGPLIRMLGAAARVIHTGQHYDANLSSNFLEELRLGQPDLHLGIGGRTRGVQIGEATARLDEAFRTDRPAAVIVHGDTNATVSGALAANAVGIPLVHLEAGLRSFDRAMPEEHNRVVADHLSDLLLAPTDVNRANLAAEGIGGDKVLMVGNTVVDAVMDLLPSSQERAAVVAEHRLERNRFVVATFHRPENVDDTPSLEAILSTLADLPMSVVLPLHPRTDAGIRSRGLGHLLEKLNVMAPIGYRHFLALAAESALLISDSGGVQEESSVIKRPVLVVRNSTERPEILGTFAQLVPPGRAMANAAALLLSDIDGLHQRLAMLPSPYGDGTTAGRAAAALSVLLNNMAHRRRSLR